MTYAQISSSTVQNTIVLDDPALAPMFGPGEGYDYCLRIDNITDIDGNPIGIGWTYDGTNYYPPPGY